jgi:hypothetical protein
MKKIAYLLSLVLLLSVTSCIIVPKRVAPVGTAGNSGKVPPGQAKKVSGSQSAKPHAPGQQKKK